MEKKSILEKNTLKAILSVIMLIVVAIAVSNGNIQSNQKMKLTTVRGYIEAISDNDLAASKKYVLKDVDYRKFNLLNAGEENNSVRYIKFISMEKVQNFKPQKIYLKDGKSKLYLKGSIVKVSYIIKYKNSEKNQEKKEKIFTMVKTINGSYKIVNIENP